MPSTPGALSPCDTAKKRSARSEVAVCPSAAADGGDPHSQKFGCILRVGPDPDLRPATRERRGGQRGERRGERRERREERGERKFDLNCSVEKNPNRRGEERRGSEGRNRTERGERREER